MSAKTTILHENGTDDELYPVTKASVTYRNDGTTTVEGTLTDYDTLEEKFGDTSATLPTTAQTVVEAIAEHENDISTLKGNLSVTGIYDLGFAIDVKPASFNVPSNSRHFLLITGPYSTRGHAIYAVSCNTSGTSYAYKIGGTDDMPTSVSGSNNSLAISSTSTSSVTCDICDICLHGNKITIAS